MTGLPVPPNIDRYFSGRSGHKAVQWANLILFPRAGSLTFIQQYDDIFTLTEKVLIFSKGFSVSETTLLSKPLMD